MWYQHVINQTSNIVTRVIIFNYYAIEQQHSTDLGYAIKYTF